MLAWIVSQKQNKILYNQYYLKWKIQNFAKIHEHVFSPENSIISPIVLQVFFPRIDKILPRPYNLIRKNDHQHKRVSYFPV